MDIVKKPVTPLNIVKRESGKIIEHKKILLYIVLEATADVSLRIPLGPALPRLIALVPTITAGNPLADNIATKTTTHHAL